MRTTKTKYESRSLDMDDVGGIRAFLEDADVVDGPAELRTIVAELWPEFLHKVKPPRSEMH
jgi:hypothetical protein